MRFLKLVTAVLLILGSTAASAELFLLEATSDYSSFGDFTVLFEDTGDGLLEWDEVVSFSGIDMPGFGWFDDLLLAIPTIPRISSFSFDPNAPYYFGATEGSWSFSESPDLRHFSYISVGAFTYAVKSAPELRSFDDVPPEHWAFRHIETLVRKNITAGCGTDNYCPKERVSRAQLAVFLVRAMYGHRLSLPAATGRVFFDVAPDDFAASYIEQLFWDRIVNGCGKSNFCPDVEVSRAQMAVLLLRAKYGSSYSPPWPYGVFDDVPASHWAAGWIEQLAAEGITAGCGNGNYCPGAAVTRDQLAVFLVRTFGL